MEHPNESHGKNAPIASPSQQQGTSQSDDSAQPRYQSRGDFEQKFHDIQLASSSPEPISPTSSSSGASGSGSTSARPMKKARPDGDEAAPLATTSAQDGHGEKTKRIRIKGPCSFNEKLELDGIGTLVLEEITPKELRQFIASTKELDSLPAIEEIRVLTKNSSMAHHIFAATSYEAEQCAALGEFCAAMSVLCPNLKRLDLSDNRLLQLPDEIKQLKNLEDVNLEYHRLRGLPRCLFELPNLTRLNLARSEGWRDEDWDEWDKLPQLTSLDLSFCRTNQGELPPSLLQMANLKKLNVSSMELVSLPNGFCNQLRNLEVLKASKNSLVEVPLGLFGLSKLRVVDLSNNKLEGEIPPEIANLTNLKILLIHRNQLTKIAPELCQCVSLTKAKVFGNAWLEEWRWLDMAMCSQSILLFMRHILRRDGEHGPDAFPFIREIPIEELQLGDKLGKGHFADVYEGTWQGKLVAVKIFRPPTPDTPTEIPLADPQPAEAATEMEVAEEPQYLVIQAGELDTAKAEGISLKDVETLKFVREVGMMCMLRDSPQDSLVKIVGISTNGPRKCIIMEKAGVSLRTLLKQGMAMTNRLAAAKSVAKALRSLKDTLHGDLHCGNVLEGRAGDLNQVKLADFGLSKVIFRGAGGSRIKHNAMKQYMMSVMYLPCAAPEVLLGSDFSTKSDVYSFGTVLFELFTHGQQLPRLSESEILQLLLNKKHRDIPMCVPWSIRLLIKACWEYEAWRRPRADVLTACLFYLLRGYELEGDACKYFDEEYGRTNFKVPGDSLSYWHLWRLLYGEYHLDQDDTEVDTRPTN